MHRHSAPSRARIIHAALNTSHHYQQVLSPHLSWQSVPHAPSWSAARRIRWTERPCAARSDLVELNTSSAAPNPVNSGEDEFLDQAIQYAEFIHGQEDESGAALETQAATLTAALGIVATLLAGGGGLFFDQISQAPHRVMPLILVGAYGAAGVFLLLALAHAVAALGLNAGDRPDPAKYLDLKGTSLAELRRHRLEALVLSQQKNRAINDQMAHELAAGYKDFQHSAICSLVAGGTVVVYGLWLQLS
jgi:hypothetical protein